MSREIKFRAWTPALNAFVYFDNFVIACLDDIVELSALSRPELSNGREQDDLSDNEIIQIETDTPILEQFIGKDVDDLDAYVGDIISDGMGTVLEIRDDAASGIFAFAFKSGQAVPTPMRYKVVGNIHEGPRRAGK